jgi:hypothetical protein
VSFTFGACAKPKQSGFFYGGIMQHKVGYDKKGYSNIEDQFFNSYNRSLNRRERRAKAKLDKKLNKRGER